MTNEHVVISDTVGRIMFAGMIKYFCWPPSVNRLFSPATWEQECSTCRDKTNNIRFHCIGKSVAAMVCACDVIQSNFDEGP